MFDFSNLSDVEFEKLCGDILSRKLGVKLRYFSPGRDGGIDLVDDKTPINIVVQVKHYARSSFSSLLTSLKKEVGKVENIGPEQYYICVSQQLTADNINEIFKLFNGYMKDTSHIITRDILVEFLNDDSNQDILRKNFKLWLLSDKLLKDIFNNQVFIDSEVLLDDINTEFKYFVQTRVFNEALKILKKVRLLMLHGAPGVGKSINSKMLAAAFVKEGYLIRYTTDGEVSNIKSAISKNPEVKEVILLDDCLGQYYFNLKKGQDRELISLIKYINQYENKVLILNTRVTVLNEAKRTRLEFRHYFEKGKVPLKTIDMEELLLEEKAEIFYNHLLKNDISKKYYDRLKDNRVYRDIIRHINYNPRIIEFVTEEYRYSLVEPKDYYKYIINNLNNPYDVWADEFEEKLEEVDRIFMYTLFSLTDTHVDETVLEECFIYRLTKEGRSHTTINFFSIVKKRLTKSLVKIIDVYNSKKIGVLNPSINDYMNSHLISNKIGLNSIRESMLYIEQLERMYDKQAAEDTLISKLNSGGILKSIGNKNIEYLFYCIVKYNILEETFKPTIKDCFNKINVEFDFFNEKVTKKDLVVNFLKEKSLFNFYEIEASLNDEHLFDDIICDIEYIGLLEIYGILNNEDLTNQESNDVLLSTFWDELDYYLNELEIFEYIEYIDGYEEVFQNSMRMQLLFNDFSKKEEEEAIKKEQKFCMEIRTNIKNDIRTQIDRLIDYEMMIEKKMCEYVDRNITNERILEQLEKHFINEQDYYEDSNKRDLNGFELGDIDATDVIFDREFNGGND